MRSALFDQSHMESQTQERFALQSAGKMLRVALGPDVLALKGSMVAYQGRVEFNHESAGSVGKLLKRVVTNEDTPLMRVSGAGEVFFAHRANEVFMMQLEGDAISVGGDSLLCFDATLDWEVERVKGAGMLSAGAFNTTIRGHGVVALVSEGTPLVLDCAQLPTYVDMQAAVAWSADLTPSVVSSANMRSLLRGGTGELAQLAFHGPGFVVVQPSEGAPPASQGGGNGGGSGGAIGRVLGDFI